MIYIILKQDFDQQHKENVCALALELYINKRRVIWGKSSMNSDQYILLVEDDLDISEAVESILKEEGYNIKCVFNGKEALEFLSSSPQNPSLILLDIMMPYMNGYEFREEQLKNAKISEIPTIILSAAGQHEDIDKLHFQECLKKPLDLETLIDVVKRNVITKN